MASNYNRRPLPVEVLVDDGRWRVIRRRQTVDDLLCARDRAMTGSADRVRRTRPERQANAGRAAARSAQGRGPQSRGWCRFPTTGRRSARRSPARCRASVSTAPTSCSSCTSPTGTSGSRTCSAGWTAGSILVCDRYMASSIAYGEAMGLDPAWLADIQRFLPRGGDHDPARHRARDGRSAQVGRSRSLRARPRAAGARARELPPAGGRPELGTSRRRAAEGCDRRRRLHRGRVTTRAAVSARTSRTPALLRARARTPRASPRSCSHRRPARRSVPASAAGGARRRERPAHVGVPPRGRQARLRGGRR